MCCARTEATGIVSPVATLLSGKGRQRRRPSKAASERVPGGWAGQQCTGARVGEETAPPAARPRRRTGSSVCSSRHGAPDPGQPPLRLCQRRQQLALLEPAGGQAERDHHDLRYRCGTVQVRHGERPGPRPAARSAACLSALPAASLSGRKRTLLAVTEHNQKYRSNSSSVGNAPCWRPERCSCASRFPGWQRRQPPQCLCCALSCSSAQQQQQRLWPSTQQAHAACGQGVAVPVLKVPWSASAARLHAWQWAAAAGTCMPRQTLPAMLRPRGCVRLDPGSPLQAPPESGGRTPRCCVARALPLLPQRSGCRAAGGGVRRWPEAVADVGWPEAA